MIMGYNFFGKDLQGNVFMSNTEIGDIHYHDLKNCKVDYEKIDEALIDYNPTKLDWDYDSIIVTDFSSLEVSNISDTNVPIKYLRVKKRKKDDLTWQDVKIFDFDKKIRNYVYEDLLVESLEDYEYCLQAVATNGIIGSEKIQSVETDYEGVWVVDNNLNQHQFNYGLNENMELSEINNMGRSTILESLGGRYPIMASNGSNYRRFSVKAVLISKETERNHGQIDRKAEKKYRRLVEDFLKDGKPKIIKESDNLYILGVIPRDSISIAPCNDLDRQIAEVSFDVVEIGDANDIERMQELEFTPRLSDYNIRNQIR